MDELIDFSIPQLRKQNILHLLTVCKNICFSHFFKPIGLNSMKPFKAYNFLNRQF